MKSNIGMRIENPNTITVNEMFDYFHMVRDRLNNRPVPGDEFTNYADYLDWQVDKALAIKRENEDMDYYPINFKRVLNISSNEAKLAQIFVILHECYDEGYCYNIPKYEVSKEKSAERVRKYRELDDWYVGLRKAYNLALVEKAKKQKAETSNDIDFSVQMTESKRQWLHEVQQMKFDEPLPSEFTKWSKLAQSSWVKKHQISEETVTRMGTVPNNIF